MSSSNQRALTDLLSDLELQILQRKSLNNGKWKRGLNVKQKEWTQKNNSMGTLRFWNRHIPNWRRSCCSSGFPAKPRYKITWIIFKIWSLYIYTQFRREVGQWQIDNTKAAKVLMRFEPTELLWHNSVKLTVIALSIFFSKGKLLNWKWAILPIYPCVLVLFLDKRNYLFIRKRIN